MKKKKSTRDEGGSAVFLGLGSEARGQCAGRTCVYDKCNTRLSKVLN